jgi:hypothetical protein
MLTLYAVAVLAGTVASTLVLDFDVHHGTSQNMIRGRPEKQAIKRGLLPVEAPLTNVEQLLYMINFTLGSDKQPMAAQLDTGSLDLWVVSSENDYCITSSNPNSDANAEACGLLGSFNLLLLMSFNMSSEIFGTQYGSGSFASGYWCTDTLGLGEVLVSSFMFGYANSTTSNINIFGIGPLSTELLRMGDGGDSSTTALQTRARLCLEGWTMPSLRETSALCP